MKITIGGVEVEVADGSSVRADGGTVTVNGRAVGTYPSEAKVEVAVHGDCGTLTVGTGTVKVAGSADAVAVGTGPVHCGDVAGDVAVGTGSVSCGRVTGSVSVRMGSITSR